VYRNITARRFRESFYISFAKAKETSPICSLDCDVFRKERKKERKKVSYWQRVEMWLVVFALYPSQNQSRHKAMRYVTHMTHTNWRASAKYHSAAN